MASSKGYCCTRLLSTKVTARVCASRCQEAWSTSCHGRSHSNPSLAEPSPSRYVVASSQAAPALVDVECAANSRSPRSSPRAASKSGGRLDADADADARRNRPTSGLLSITQRRQLALELLHTLRQGAHRGRLGVGSGVQPAQHTHRVGDLAPQ